jgi:nucleoid-associated protein YgaU
LSATADSDVKRQLDDTAAKLDASLRAFALLQGEQDQLKSAAKAREDEAAGLKEKAAALAQQVTASQTEAAASAKLRDKISALEYQLAASNADLTAKSAALDAASKRSTSGETDLSATASAKAETEAKLATALRSYSLAQADIDNLKASGEKLAADKAALEQQLAVAKNAMPAAAQAQGFREQLRQTQAQLAALADENARLKTQLAGNTAARTTPARPAAVAAVTPTPATSVASTNPPSALPAVGSAKAGIRNPPSPAPAPAARTHVIAPGDTLTRISVLYYSTPNRWSDIYAANRDVLRDEKSLVIGRTLRIP